MGNKKYYSMYIIIDDEPESFNYLVQLDKDTSRFIIEPIYIIGTYGTIVNVETGHVVKQHVDNLGYCRVTLNAIDTKNDDEHTTTQFLVHRLVAMTFVDGYDYNNDRIVINHFDSNPSHNYYKNLEWCTQDENIQHAVATGNMDAHLLQMSKNNIKFDNKLVRQIAKLLEDGSSPADIYKILNISDLKIKSLYGIIERIRYDPSFEYLRDEFDIPVNILNKTDIDEVHKICKLLQDGLLARDIIKYLNITDSKEKERMRTKISKIRLGKHYTEISSQYNIPKTDATYNKKYSNDDIHMICRLISKGYSNSEIIDIMKLDNSNKLARKYITSIRGRFIRKDITKLYKW